MSPAARTIVLLNIEHFKELLKTETDPQKRKTITQLLAEGEEKLPKLATQERDEHH